MPDQATWLPPTCGRRDVKKVTGLSACGSGPTTPRGGKRPGCPPPALRHQAGAGPPHGHSCAGRRSGTRDRLPAIRSRAKPEPRGDLQRGPPGGAVTEHRSLAGTFPRRTDDQGAPGLRAGVKPLSLVVTAGQRGDAPQFEAVMAYLCPRQGRGRPRTRPDRVRADKAYSSRAIRAHLRRRGIAATIPVPDDQAAHRRRRAAAVAVHPPSTRSTTAPATPSNAASTASSATARWPPATTSSPSATRPSWKSPPSTNGSTYFETRPRRYRPGCT